LQSGALKVTSGIVFNTTKPYHSGTVAFANLFTNISFANPGIGNCFNHASPNWQPTSVATPAGGQIAPAIPPNDGFFEVTSYIGAVAPAPADDWTTGWTAFPQS
jgi:hypothetical protein